MKIDKRVKWGLQALLVIVVILIAFNWKGGLLDSYNGYYLTWEKCFDYVDNGTLFGGQPRCENGPVVIYAGYIIHKVFGQDYFQFSFLIFSFAVNLLMLFLILKIIKKETGLDFYFLVSLLYFSLIYPHAMTRADAMFSALFFIIGFYLLYCSKMRFREFVAGAALFMSILSKTSGLFAVFPLLLFYFFSNPIEITSTKKASGKHIKIKTGKKEYFAYFSKNELIKFITLVFGFFLVMGLVILLLPNTPEYMFLSFIQPRMDEAPTSSFQAAMNFVPNFSSNTITYIQFYILLFAGIYLLRKKWNPFSFSLLFVLFFFNFKMFQTAGFVFSAANKYTITVIALFIVAMAIIYQEIRNNRNKKIIFAAAIILLVALPLARDFSFNFLKHKVDVPTAIIPPQDGYVLTAFGGYKQTSVGYAPVEVMDAFEIGWVKQLVRMGVINYSYLPRDILNMSYNDAQQYVYKQEYLPYFKKGLDEGKYSLIMIGPPGWEHLVNFLNAMNQSTLSGYCVVNVPDIKYGTWMAKHDTQLVFKNKNDCQQTITNMQKHYNENFKSICLLSKSAWDNIIVPVAATNGVTLNQKCESNWDLLDYQNNRTIGIVDLLFVLLLVGLIALYYYKFDESQKE